MKGKAGCWTVSIILLTRGSLLACTIVELTCVSFEMSADGAGLALSAA